MAYIIEQKIKGNIYLYKVESYWDKDKKQSRQKRTYLGPKGKLKKSNIKQTKSTIVHKNYGNIFFLDFILKQLGLEYILQNIFPDNYKEIIALAYYDIIEASPYYLFPFWQEEHYLPDTKKLDSSSISKLCDEIGHQQQQRLIFFEQWINLLQPVEALFYDITSISSYSTSIDFVEWGYNRDHENLPQINLGMVFCGENSLPIFYTLYPGSIVDVKTLKNCVTYLKIIGLKDFLFVLDRGFFSTSNITKMNSDKNNISFIQPLPFSLKKVKELVRLHKKELHDVSNNFKFNEELLSYKKSEIEFEGKTYVSHIYLNERAELDQRQQLMGELIDIEVNTLKNKIFPSLKQAMQFKKNNIVKKYQDLFKWNRLTRKIERNANNLKTRISKLGYFILATNKQGSTKEDILAKYRKRDDVEKVFDLLKNEIDGGRIRAHNQYNLDARLFIKFVSLILQSEITKTMKNRKLFKKYTMKEMLANLRKIKRTKIDNEIIISEISKQQRLIFDAFNIDQTELHRY